MRIILALTAAICLLGVSEVAAQSCHLREIDLCAASLLLFSQGGSGIATTDEQINRQCGYIKEAGDCVGNYTKKCMTPLHRELIGFATEGMFEQLNEFCTEGNELRNRYLVHAPCLKDAVEDLKECSKGLQTTIEFFGKVERKMFLPAGCCFFQTMRGCVQGKIQAKCGDDTVQFMTDMMEMYVANIPDIICGEYMPSSPKCEGVLPDPNTPPSGEKSNSLLGRLFSSFLSSR